MSLRLVSEKFHTDNQIFSTFAIEAASLADFGLIFGVLIGATTLITAAAFAPMQLTKDYIFKALGLIALFASIALISLIFVTDVNEKNASREALATAEAEEKLDSMLKEKYGFALLDTKVMKTNRVAGGKMKAVTLTKEPISGTTTDGKNMQIAIKVLDEGKDLIAYSYGEELTPLEAQ